METSREESLKLLGINLGKFIIWTQHKNLVESKTLKKVVFFTKEAKDSGAHAQGKNKRTSPDLSTSVLTNKS